MTAQMEIGQATKLISDHLAEGCMVARDWQHETSATALLATLFHNLGDGLGRASSELLPLRDALIDLNQVELECAIAKSVSVQGRLQDEEDQLQLQQRRQEILPGLGELLSSSYHRAEVVTWKVYEESAKQLLRISHHALSLALLEKSLEEHNQETGITDQVARLERNAEVCHLAKDLIGGGTGGWEVNLTPMSKEVVAQVVARSAG